jgi:hypothetical protein
MQEEIHATKSTPNPNLVKMEKMNLCHTLSKEFSISRFMIIPFSPCSLLE